ncbi:stage III sporulation protein SpoAB [Sporolactobacillus sp. THM7-4]|nr:stage III sporulation protein SpoAB [Sporolactobacillus sp. THM7-4]
MIHFLGASLILFASTSTGFLIAGRYRSRPKEIRQWRSALQSMEAEILYSRVPIEDVSRHLSRQLPKPVSFFFDQLQEKLASGDQPLRVSWRQTVEQFWPVTALKNSEKEILLQFGETLGAQDVDNQKKHIQLALAHLEREETEARAAQTANEKMIKSLGFLAGVLLILLFI